ncbi:hypothetical protein HMPREF9612_00146 [Cutibacterium acnes HL063PA2]|nr:hypothetical protein HMPREF9612_00146 [Cutibacterium acnes HL063PA2]
MFQPRRGLSPCADPSDVAFVARRLGPDVASTSPTSRPRCHPRSGAMEPTRLLRKLRPSHHIRAPEGGADSLIRGATLP